MVPLVDAPNKVSSLTYLTRPNLTYRRYPRLRTYNVYICLYALYKIEPSNLRAQHSKDNMWMWCLYQTINIKFSNARDSGVSKNHQVPARSHAWSIMLPWRNCNLSIAYFQTHANISQHVLVIFHCIQFTPIPHMVNLSRYLASSSSSGSANEAGFTDTWWVLGWSSDWPNFDAFLRGFGSFSLTISLAILRLTQFLGFFILNSNKVLGLAS